MILHLSLKHYFSSIYFAFLLLIFINACVVPQKAAHVSVDAEDSSKGILLFSFSYSKPTIGRYTLYVNNADTYAKSTIMLTPVIRASRLATDSLDVYYSSTELPEGNYRIVAWMIEFPNKKYFSKGNFSIPFSVKGGQVNYFGDYFAINQKTEVLGVRNPGSNILIVSNRFKNDYPFIREKFPKLVLENTADAVPDFGGSNTIFSGMLMKGIHVP
jgi:hypothetical protein